MSFNIYARTLIIMIMLSPVKFSVKPLRCILNLGIATPEIVGSNPTPTTTACKSLQIVADFGINLPIQIIPSFSYSQQDSLLLTVGLPSGLLHN